MATDILNEANPKVGASVNQTAGGKNMVESAAHPTHVAATAELEVTSINQRLARSEQTPTTPWTSGDAGRLAKQVLRIKSPR
jgi:hypothetical protein